MARLPNWRDQAPQKYVGARKWGDGVSPIHGKRGGFEDRNRNPGLDIPPDTGLVSLDFGYTEEDYITGVDLSFMDAHPNWNDPSIRGRSDMPSWGMGRNPVPGGTGKRVRKQGMSYREGVPQAVPSGTVGEGWTNKESGEVLESRTSDDGQLFVRTSRVQLNQAKTNTAATVRGTDDPRAGITTRLTGMKIKNYSGGIRHEDMTPREQDYRPRPWRYRGAGTGPEAWMDANAWQTTTPVTRSIPADVDQGREENDLGTDTPDYGETDWF
jgi:hypothetical protein